MTFRDVCATIRDYAFVSSNLPLIVSLEVHTSPEQQEVMVELMTEYWRGMLVDLPLDPSHSSEDTKLPTLKDLENKILVKVKRVSQKSAFPAAKPTPLQAPAGLTPAQSNQSAQSDNTSDSSDDVAEKPTAPKPKVIDALSKLGVYFGGYHYKGLDVPGESSLSLPLLSPYDYPWRVKIFPSTISLSFLAQLACMSQRLTMAAVLKTCDFSSAY